MTEPASATTYFSEDMESGASGWSHYWISGTSIPDNWALSTSRCNSSSNSYYSGIEVANWLNGGDTALETPPINLTGASSARLTFWHWYYFDGNPNTTFYPDGGVVEINSGSGWTQIFPVGGYDNVITSVGGSPMDNPLVGLSAYTNLPTGSSGWTQEEFDISSHTGGIVNIRFHVGWDYGTNSEKEGWYIDDVVVDDNPISTVLWSTTPNDPMQSAFTYTFSWSITNGTTVSHTNVHYTTDPTFSSYSETPMQTGAPGSYSDTITPTCAMPTVYYFRAHATVDTVDYYSVDISRSCNPGPPPPPPILQDDMPSYYASPVPDYYQFDVLSADHAVVGIRPDTGDDFDIEVYTDITFASMIESSASSGDAVDFVVLDKMPWSSPPNKGAKVISGSTNYTVEMENDVMDYPVTNTWSGSMDIKPGGVEVLDAFEIFGIAAASFYTVTLSVPATADLDLFIFSTTGERNTATASSTNVGAGVAESMSFVAPTNGDYLLVVTNEDGGTGTYMVNAPTPDTLGVQGTDRAPSAVVQGDNKVLMEHLTLTANTGSITVSSVRVDLAGTGTDSDIAAVDLYDDSNDNGSFDPGIDALLDSSSFVGGSLTFTGFTKNVNTGVAENLLILFDISPTASTGNTVGVGLLDETYLTVDVPDNISTANFPIQSTNSLVNPGPVLLLNDDPYSGSTPAPDAYQFESSPFGATTVKVGIYDHPMTFDISYWTGGNSNLYTQYATILNSDPAGRFTVSVITDLSSATLAGIDVLLLPDNAVPDVDLMNVDGFFGGGGGIVTVDSSACFAAYSGYLWPGAAGTNGYGIFWQHSSFFNDQEILLSHDITADYVVGNIYSSLSGDAQMFDSMLPLDAVALTARSTDHTRVYVAARDVPSEGRIVELGPYAGTLIPADIHELVRDAIFWSGGSSLGNDHTVLGISPPAGSDYDLDVYSDSTLSTLIVSSNSLGDTVDFAVLDKNVWGSPPNRAARVTAKTGTGNYLVEMENEVADHSIMDMWSGSMDLKPGGVEVLDAYELNGIATGQTYWLNLSVPASLDLDMFVFSTTGARSAALGASENAGLDTDENITFTAPSSGDYLLVITNVNGATGSYTVNPETPDTLTVVGINKAPSNVPQGTSNVLMEQLTLTAGSKSVSLDSIAVDLAGTGTSADITGASLYDDTNDNGIYDLGTDMLLDNSGFIGGTLTFTGFSKVVNAGIAENLLILYDISTTATVGNTVGVELLNNGYLNVAAPDAVSSMNFPIQSTNSAISFTPLQLNNDVPHTGPTPASDQYRFNIQTFDHGVVGIRPPSGANYDIGVYSDTTFSSLIESSSSTGDKVDFVVLDKMTWSSPPQRAAEVIAVAGTGPYVIEMENDVMDRSVMDTWIGTFDSRPGGIEVIDAYEVFGIMASSTYMITLDVPATADLDLFIFSSTGRRDTALASSTTAGAGKDEIINFAAPTSGEYLLVITNEDGGIGTYTVNSPPTIDTLTFAGTDKAQPDVVPGSANNLMEQLTLTAGANSVTVNSIQVMLSGTGIDSDITCLKLYDDFNDNGQYDAGIDIWLDSNNFVGGMATFTIFPGITVNAGTPENLLILYDIAPGATIGHTVGVLLIDSTYATVTFPDIVSNVNFPIASSISTIGSTGGDTLTVQGVDRAPVSAPRGYHDIVVEQLILSVDANSALVSSVRVELSGSGTDADIATVKLYHDVDGDGILDSGSDPLLDASVYVGGKALLFIAGSFVVSAGTTKSLLVAYDLSAAAVPGNTVGVKLTEKTSIELLGSDVVSPANFPICSSEISVTTGPTVVPGHGTLMGTVRDEDGMPVAGAFVSVTGTSHAAATDYDGQYEISIQAGGSYAVTVLKDGYESKTVSSVQIIKDQLTSLDFVLELVKGRIFGRVVDPSGSPIADADVTLFDSDGYKIGSMKTDNNGAFKFEDLELGMYTVKISKQGYDDVTEIYMLHVKKPEGDLGTMEMSSSAGLLGLHWWAWLVISAAIIATLLLLIYYVRRRRKPETSLPPPPPPPPVDSPSSGNLHGANEYRPTVGPEEPPRDREVSKEASNWSPKPEEAKATEMPGENEEIKKDEGQSA